MREWILTSRAGEAFTIRIGDDGRIADVEGPWPTEPGAELVLEGDLPAHGSAVDAPESVRADALARGLDVCFHSESPCRTCYCDGSGRLVRCVAMC